MNDTHILNAMQQMLYYVVIAVCIITLPVLAISLIMSIIQAATQINEMTLTFIPKFIVMFLLLFILSPWLMQKLILITHHYLDNLALFIR
ncbi:flagellar biosynthetic protein FliQ [Aquicella lusitana]|uniref:Flagellar biosynthetic protein FliQ n=1 Tax=Aquicella lusitana TaxID=254246 RepID=A0A370G7M8_9COXI|nr:flagellar biosynthetic protein FliQ [Aquicella lusitana]RDI38534.1 flagellar biosynthetic protein FliQ [Aquicella lusitana]VVC74621.1 Flagellar biosynthetic protein FliQ [Aquicella lusitana]